MKPAACKEKAENRKDGSTALHRDFPLNGTFPFKDMRSQNLVKWPLGN